MTLVQHVRKFLFELGVGFAFVGQQYHLEIGGQDFYIDLLFYHLKLRCFVVIEPKQLNLSRNLLESSIFICLLSMIFFGMLTTNRALE